MANYSIIQQGDTVQTYVMEVVVDTRAEIDTLPTDWAAGSSCLVIEDSSVFMLGNDGHWHELMEEEDE